MNRLPPRVRALGCLSAVSIAGLDARDEPPEGEGSCELLAVVRLDRADHLLSLDGMAGSHLTRLGLPYAFPLGVAP